MLAPNPPDVPWAGSGARGPAPAGAFQRAYAGAYEPPVEDEADEEPYVPVRGKVRFRLRGLLRTVAGRVVLGLFLFIALSATAVAAITLRSYLLHDPRFVISASANVETIGNTHITRAQLLSVFGEDVERNIFKVPLAQRRADLERLPWVEHATVMRLLPNTLRVAVVERTPVAFVRQGTSIGLVDASGVLLDMPQDAPGDPHYSFPVLTGIATEDPLSTRAARMEIYRRFMKELDSSGEKVSETLSEVDVSNPEDVKALIPSGSTDILVHFGDEDFLTRYRHFEQHLPEWKQQYPKLASADMRYERQVVLEMAPGAGLPQQASTENVTANAAPVTTPEPIAAAPKTERHAAAAARTPSRRAHPARRPAMKPVAATSGTSASNAKMFAALAAARQKQGAISAKPGQGPQ
jgi:cell division protein FtsQ